jgi:hypothetical protein
MIDLVYWSFLAALLPIVLHVCVRILSLVRKKGQALSFLPGVESRLHCVTFR